MTGLFMFLVAHLDTEVSGVFRLGRGGILDPA